MLAPWRNGEMFARAEWDKQHPKRYTLLMRNALTLLKLRWWERVSVWNIYHQGRGFEAGYQHIDFIVQLKGRGRFAILIKNKNSLRKPREKAAWQAKQVLLWERDIPTLIVPSTWSSNDFYGAVMIFIRRNFK